MDMFYAAVEIRDRPELAGKPVAVGGNAMISTSNYEARKYGVSVSIIVCSIMATADFFLSLLFLVHK